MYMILVLSFLKLEKILSPPCSRKINIRSNPVDSLSASICFICPWRTLLYWFPRNNKSDQTLEGGIGERMHDKGRDWKGRF
jgi:hypothetical protein